MSSRTPLAIAAFLLLPALTACQPNYSPNTYSANVVQQANKVDQGIIVGVRAVTISAATTLGAATGAAAGGIAGSQAGPGAVSAFGALGGTVAGGVVGAAVEHTQDDTFGYEYIVRKPNGDLLSVTQKDDAPLPLGQRVLIIEGAQARVVVDYTVEAVADPHRPAADVQPARAVKAAITDVPAEAHPQSEKPAAPAAVPEPPAEPAKAETVPPPTAAVSAP